MIGTFDQFGSPIIGSQYIAERNKVEVGVKGVFELFQGTTMKHLKAVFLATGR